MTKNTDKAIIIVAGGKGTRMGISLPKQFIVLGGKPILMHTIERFYHFCPEMKIILVLPKDDHFYWNQLCLEYNFTIQFTLAEGGETRFHSVKNALAFLDAEKWVGVHDGVRPFVGLDVISNSFKEVLVAEAVIPTIDVVDTLRHCEGDQSVTVDRSAYQLVQTPQVFKADLLKAAYEQEFNTNFTDDASVVEVLGHTVKCIPGNRENIKVTTPFDLKIGEALLKC